MLKFEVTDKAISALWDGLTLELDELASSRDRPSFFLEVARCNFLRMLANFPQNVLAGVTDIAPGTGEPVLRIVICDRYKRHVTLAAKRAYKIRTH